MTKFAELDEGQLATIIVNIQAQIEGIGTYPFPNANIDRIARIKALEKKLSTYKTEQHRRTHMVAA